MGDWKCIRNVCQHQLDDDDSDWDDYSKWYAQVQDDFADLAMAFSSAMSGSDKVSMILRNAFEQASDAQVRAYLLCGLRQSKTRYPDGWFADLAKLITLRPPSESYFGCEEGLIPTNIASLVHLNPEGLICCLNAILKKCGNTTFSQQLDVFSSLGKMAQSPKKRCRCESL